MPRYGTGALYGDAHLYGTSVGDLTTDEDAVAGQTPALPDRRVPWRAACAEIWTWDPLTWLPIDQLLHVSDTATRQISLSDLGRQTETLTFDLFPPLAVDLLEGDWLAVQWTVANPSNSTAYLGGVFRVSDAPNIDRDASGILYHVVAVDWLSYIIPHEISGSGWTTIGDLAMGGANYPEVLASFLGHYTVGGSEGWAAPMAFEEWTDFAQNPIFVTEPSGQMQLTTPGTPAGIGDVLAWFWPIVGGYTLAYAANGGLLLRGKTPADSGLYITDDTLVLGTVPPPWETLQRTYRRPDILQVQYWLNNADGVTIGFGVAYAITNHDLTLARIERVVDTGTAVTLAGFPTPFDFCQWRLSRHLAAADTLAVTLDSAFPPPPMGTLVAVRILPTGSSTNGIAGYYRITGWTQPVGVGQASVQLEWWAALP